MSSVRAVDEGSVEKKFAGARGSQESIQSLSLWALHHKAQHERIVNVWLRVLKKAKLAQRVMLFNVCNEIVQTCKRKHAISYKDSFKGVLPDAALFVRESSVRPNIERIFTIWGERGVYDTTFVDELITVLNSAQGRAAPAKLLTEFKPSHLREVVSNFTQLEKEVDAKRRKLSTLNLDLSSQNYMKLLKERSRGAQYTQQVEDARRTLEQYVASLTIEAQDRAAMLEALEQGELFYDAQYGEARIVVSAYKNFGARVHGLRRKLGELRRALPDPLSPPLSPGAQDAPSPAPSLGGGECEGEDNTEMMDMDMSDCEDHGGTAYRPEEAGLFPSPSQTGDLSPSGPAFPLTSSPSARGFHDRASFIAESHPSHRSPSHRPSVSTPLAADGKGFPVSTSTSHKASPPPHVSSSTSPSTANSPWQHNSSPSAVASATAPESTTQHFRVSAARTPETSRGEMRLRDASNPPGISSSSPFASFEAMSTRVGIPISHPVTVGFPAYDLTGSSGNLQLSTASSFPRTLRTVDGNYPTSIPPANFPSAPASIGNYSVATAIVGDFPYVSVTGLSAASSVDRNNRIPSGTMVPNFSDQLVQSEKFLPASGFASTVLSSLQARLARVAGNRAPLPLSGAPEFTPATVVADPDDEAREGNDGSTTPVQDENPADIAGSFPIVASVSKNQTSSSRAPSMNALDMLNRLLQSGANTGGEFGGEALTQTTTGVMNARGSEMVSLSALTQTVGSHQIAATPLAVGQANQAGAFYGAEGHPYLVAGRVVIDPVVSRFIQVASPNLAVDVRGAMPYPLTPSPFQLEGARPHYIPVASGFDPITFHPTGGGPISPGSVSYPLGGVVTQAYPGGPPHPRDPGFMVLPPAERLNREFLPRDAIGDRFRGPWPLHGAAAHRDPTFELQQRPPVFFSSSSSGGGELMSPKRYREMMDAERQAAVERGEYALPPAAAAVGEVTQATRPADDPSRWVHPGVEPGSGSSRGIGHRLLSEAGYAVQAGYTAEQNGASTPAQTVRGRVDADCADIGEGQNDRRELSVDMGERGRTEGAGDEESINGERRLGLNQFGCDADRQVDASDARLNGEMEQGFGDEQFGPPRGREQFEPPNGGGDGEFCYDGPVYSDGMDRFHPRGDFDGPRWGPGPSPHRGGGEANFPRWGGPMRGRGGDFRGWRGPRLPMRGGGGRGFEGGDFMGRPRFDEPFAGRARGPMFRGMSGPPRGRQGPRGFFPRF